MNKQELIDKAVQHYQGRLPKEINPGSSIVYYDQVDFYFISRLYFKQCCNHDGFVCTMPEFEQRARELGWINGYQYGVEYPTNGKNPDLPDDVWVEYVLVGGYEGVGFVEELSFELNPRGKEDCTMVKFRIVDERYKTNQLDGTDVVDIDNSCHESDDPRKAQMKEKSDLSFAITDAVNVAIDAGLSGYAKKLQEVNRELLSESKRERFVDAAAKIMTKADYEFTGDLGLDAENVTPMAFALFDAGFRAPSDKG